MPNNRLWPFVVLIGCTGVTSELLDSGFTVDAGAASPDAGPSADGGELATDAGRGDAGRGDAGTTRDAGVYAFDSGLVSGLSDGGALGLFQDDVWTPGRDPNGVVTRASWDTVPKLRWVQVAGTRVDSLDTEVKAAIPGWRDWGTEGWGGVTDDWNGLAIDQLHSRVWLIAGGGHSGSSNNGIYEFNLHRMRWVIEHLPSDPSAWSASYRGNGGGGTFSGCAESEALRLERLDAGVWSPINDAWYDELFWDKAPTSRHTYSALAYASVSDELLLSSRGQRLWRYSLATHEWTYRRVLEDGLRNYDGAGTYAFYDEVTQEYLHGGSADAVYNSVGYKLATNEWVPWGSPWSIWGVTDARDGRDITAMTVINKEGLYAGQYWRYNLDSRTVTAGGGGATVQLGSGVDRSSFTPENWYYGGASLCFVPPLNLYWYWQQMGDGSMRLFEVDPSTTPWTLWPNPATAGRLPQPHPNLMRKMVYLPSFSAVLLVGQASKDVWLYKF